MLVCHCTSVNDRTIRDVLANGAGDEVEVGRACGAGTRCGGCLPEVRRLCALAEADRPAEVLVSVS